MATRTLSALASNNTNALFRIWVAEVHAALTAFGWSQASGVGTQIDPTTVTRPTSTNTYQGYSVWKMNDSLQSTTAVFMRLDFGTGATTDVPAMKVQVAIGGCDSSGNLTGTIGTQQTLSAAVTLQVSNTNIRTAGTSSSFRMYWRNGTTGQSPMCWAVQRDLDSSGADTSLGVSLITLQHSTVRSSQYISLAGDLGTVDTVWYALLTAASSQTGGSNTGIGPIRTSLGPFRNPMMVALCARTDFTHDSTNTATIYGGSHTFLMLTECTAMALNTLNSACGICLLWE